VVGLDNGKKTVLNAMDSFTEESIRIKLVNGFKFSKDNI
jgi:hypothetical protein